MKIPRNTVLQSDDRGNLASLHQNNCLQGSDALLDTSNILLCHGKSTGMIVCQASHCYLSNRCQSTCVSPANYNQGSCHHRKHLLLRTLTCLHKIGVYRTFQKSNASCPSQNRWYQQHTGWQHKCRVHNSSGCCSQGRDLNGTNQAQIPRTPY